MEVGASLFLSLTQTYKHARTLGRTHRCAPPTVIHSPAHPVAVSGVSQEHPLSVRLWLPASVLVIVILPDLLARSWRQESPCLPSTSASQLPPTPRIIQTSCCKVPCLLPPAIFTLASSVVLDLKKKNKKTLGAFFFWQPLSLCMGSHCCITPI